MYDENADHSKQILASILNTVSCPNGGEWILESEESLHIEDASKATLSVCTHDGESDKMQKCLYKVSVERVEVRMVDA